MDKLTLTTGIRTFHKEWLERERRCIKSQQNNCNMECSGCEFYVTVEQKQEVFNYIANNLLSINVTYRSER